MLTNETLNEENKGLSTHETISSSILIINVEVIKYLKPSQTLFLAHKCQLDRTNSHSKR